MENMGFEIYTDNENIQRIKYQESERKINNQIINIEGLEDWIYPNEWFEKRYSDVFSAAVLCKINVAKEPIIRFQLTEKGLEEVDKLNL
ncbi:hypothetical protein [Algoriella xinjiangensis]|nr:hypothetical protein [Algoriella xinjiangensis]